MGRRSFVLLSVGLVVTGLVILLRAGCQSDATRVGLASPSAPRAASVELPPPDSPMLSLAGRDRHPQIAPDDVQTLAVPKPTWRAVGQVTTGASRPLGGCEVVVTRKLGSFYRTRIGHGTTDPSGHYNIPLPALSDVGPYVRQFSLVVSASAEGHHSTESKETRLGGLEVGEVRTDIQLVPGGRLRGQVVDEHGTPAHGARFSFADYSQKDLFSFPGREPRAPRGHLGRGRDLLPQCRRGRNSRREGQVRRRASRSI